MKNFVTEGYTGLENKIYRCIRTFFPDSPLKYITDQITGLLQIVNN
jgi:hypothetical protein